MAKKISTEPYKGVRDFYPEDMFIQNYIFGPLYFLAIGIPSQILVLRYSLNKDFAKEYYKHYPENWADKLGGAKH